ncbi:MAG TPA: aldehyde dehydrogenase family protein [Steroidobacteraceae bacterium]|nr:aldehyde dehydrogenase family protein [Steroidobacteraceae bacterium]
MDDELQEHQGAYVFDADVEHAQEVASRIESGMVYIDSCVVDSPGLPCGGVENSGLGRELSGRPMSGRAWAPVV